jgi:hypothetical protein
MNMSYCEKGVDEIDQRLQAEYSSTYTPNRQQEQRHAHQQQLAIPLRGWY